MSTLASKRCFTRLETVELKCWPSETAVDFPKFLQALENPIKTLIVNEIPVDILFEAFDGRIFENLEVLRLGSLNFYNILEFQPDLSNYINVIFEGCSIPKLKEISIHAAYDYTFDEDDDLNIPKWKWQPSKKLIEHCPVLEQICIGNLSFSVDVADYLGEFRRQTKCLVYMECCDFIDYIGREISMERQELLNGLELDLHHWEEFCQTLEYYNCNCYSDYYYWNILPDDEFKRIAYVAALDHLSSQNTSIRDPEKLKKVLKMCKNVDIEGELSAKMLDSAEECVAELLKGSVVQKELEGRAKHSFWTLADLYRLRSIWDYI